MIVADPEVIRGIGGDEAAGENGGVRPRGPRVRPAGSQAMSAPTN